MIELHSWPTPNGWKISIALEEMGLPYETHFINIGRGDQFKPDFLAISPNNRIPAIIDKSVSPPLSVFETGAILVYLAEKTGKFLPTEPRARSEVLAWLFWQVGGLGPMLGQHGHFKLYAKDKIPYAIERYADETNRLYGVLDRRLAGREYVAAGEYSIADIACWPWVVTYKAQGIDLAAYPNVRRWYDKLKERPALQRGFAFGKELRGVAKDGPDEEGRKHLFGKR